MYVYLPPFPMCSLRRYTKEVERICKIYVALGNSIILQPDAWWSMYSIQVPGALQPT